MKIIKSLVDDIQEEMIGAEHYAKLANQYKDSDKVLAETYAKLADVELSHVDTLHTQVVRIIKDWQAKGNEVPKEMAVIYDWEHTKQIERIKEIKILLSIYRS